MDEDLASRAGFWHESLGGAAPMRLPLAGPAKAPGGGRRRGEPAGVTAHVSSGDDRRQDLGHARIAEAPVHSVPVDADPFAVLGLDRSASLDQAEAAYRRLVAWVHPDRLQHRPADARADAERRLRDANAAIARIRAGFESGAPATPGLCPDQRTTEDVAHEFNAQIRDTGPGGLHASWPGPHAAGVWSALRSAHRTNGPVHQVEWGSYECALDGAGVRRLLRSVSTDGSWQTEPLDLLEVGRRRVPAVDLAYLDGLIDERHRYVVTAEVI